MVGPHNETLCNWNSKEDIFSVVLWEGPRANGSVEKQSLA